MSGTSACRELSDGTTIDNGHGVDNDEQGAPIRVCRGLTTPWSQLWIKIRRLS